MEQNHNHSWASTLRWIVNKLLHLPVWLDISCQKDILFQIWRHPTFLSVFLFDYAFNCSFINSHSKKVFQNPLSPSTPLHTLTPSPRLPAPDIFSGERLFAFIYTNFVKLNQSKLKFVYRFNPTHIDVYTEEYDMNRGSVMKVCIGYEMHAGIWDVTGKFWLVTFERSYAFCYVFCGYFSRCDFVNRS